MTMKLAQHVRAQRGMTLVEATIILSVVAILAAIMAPAINGYLEQARQARTREDVKTIAEAIQNFIADNAEHKFLKDGIGTVGPPAQPPLRAEGDRVNLLVSDGDVPSLATAPVDLSAESFWRSPIDTGAVDTLSNHLVENLPTETSTNRYRNPTDITVGTPGGNNIDFARSSSAGLNAPYAWRGPYLSGPVASDPWGNRYAVNVAFLDPKVPAGTITGITAGFSASDYPRLDAFVMSAGPDEEIDTKSAQDGAVAGDDDFIYVVSSHAK